MRATGGVYAHAAELLRETTGRSCTRQNVQYWVHKHATLMKTVNDCVEDVKDLAETKLIENIRNNDTKSILFYLETKGKDRGYVRRHILTGDEGRPLMPPAQVVICMPDNHRDPELVRLLSSERQIKTTGGGNFRH